MSLKINSLVVPQARVPGPLPPHHFRMGRIFFLARSMALPDPGGIVGLGNGQKLDNICVSWGRKEARSKSIWGMRAPLIWRAPADGKGRATEMEVKRS